MQAYYMRALQHCITDLPTDQPFPDPAPSGEDPEAPTDPKPKPASLSGRIWKKLGFGTAAVSPKKAKMTEQPEPEPETIEEVMEEDEAAQQADDEDGSVAIQMEVVTSAAPEEGEGEMHQQQPRRSLGMIREEQEDEVKVQYAIVLQRDE